MNYLQTDSIVHLNVGGSRFTTSKSTLTWIPDSFFSSLLSGRIPTLRDETGAIFIDRDPRIFEIILNYLRTKQVDLNKVDTESLKHEAQYYGITPLIKRLLLCDELEQCPCGDLFFHGYLPPPQFPTVSARNTPSVTKKAINLQAPASYHSRNLSEPPILPSFNNASRQNGSLARPLPSMEAKFQVPSVSHNTQHTTGASKSNSNFPDGLNVTANAVPTAAKPSGHNRANSADFKHWKTHRSRGSADLTRQIKQELLATLKHQQDVFVDPYRVKMIRAHHSWIAVAYHNYIACFRMKDSTGWYLAYMSARMEQGVEQIALNAKSGGSQTEKLLSTALSDHTIYLWSVNDEGVANQIGAFSLSVPVDALFFIGGQLVALSKTGQVGIWHGMTQNWQVQDVLPISSYDTAGSFLLLGCTNGSIYYIDMQKFPLRMKDNDLLVTELYRDPSMDPITSISVYLTPKSSLCGNWIEIAYGTNAGSVRVIVQHPETVGHGPQLFQTFSVHRAPITKVALTTNHLISVCSEYNHVRSWMVTRFRGMISTQPGSTPLASFKVLTLESDDNPLDMNASADVGPFGDQDGEQVFVQKLVPETNQLFVRLASNGERVCLVKSVDESSITCFLVHEWEGSSRMGARPRRYLFTGHINGSIQMWDLTTALDIHISSKEKPAEPKALQGPTPNELLRLIDECEITCNSLSNTPMVTPASSILHIPSLFNNPAPVAPQTPQRPATSRNFANKNCD